MNNSFYDYRSLGSQFNAQRVKNFCFSFAGLYLQDSIKLLKKYSN